MTDQHLIEFDSYIAPDGKEYNLNDGATRFLLGQGGHGMPGIVYMTEQAPFQHGVTPLDYRVQPRLIQMLHRRNGNSRDRFWDNRSLAINLLRPNRQLAASFATGQLRKILPNGEIRDLDVLIDQGPSFPMRDPGQWDEFGWSEVIRFVAFTPIFYNPTAIETTFSLSSLSNLVFPITFPIQFGTSLLNDSQIITYTGTWLEFPVFEIDGPLNGVTIYNDTTGESFQILYSIGAGDMVTINLADRLKTVVSLVDGDIQGTVVGDLGTWHIAPDPEATDGLNTIRITGTNAVAGQTEVRLSHNSRYIGM